MTIYRGVEGVECEVRAEWFDRPCPFCNTLVRAGKKHYCRLQTTIDAVGTNGGKATVEGLQPRKGAK